MLKKTTPYVILIASLSLSASSVLSGANILWTNSDGGDFGAPENWSAGVPGAADRADIRAEGEYTIHLDEDRTIGQLRMDQYSAATQVTLDLAGYTLTSTSTSGASAALFLQGTAEETRSMTMINGTIDVALSRIGQGGGLGGEFVVGDGGVYRMRATSSQHRIGNSGIGRLRVEGTGRLIVDDGATLRLSEGGGAEGYLVITGTQARLQVETEYVQIGHSNKGELQITAGSQATLAGRLILGNATEGVGYLEVSEGAELSVALTMTVGNHGTGHASFSSGTNANIARIDINGGSTLEINAATVVSTHANPNNWREGSTYRIFLNAADATPLSIHSINLDSTLDVQLGTGFEAVLGNDYTLIDYTGVIDGSFRDANGDALLDGDQIVIGDYVFELNYGNKITGGMISLELVAIPEPSTTILGVATLVLLVTIPLHRRYKVKLHRN